METPECSTVLVIEDEVCLQELIAIVLEAEGYRVLQAANGRLGLDMVDREMPDLVLLDINMPVMDGREFARRFHAAHGSAVPIVLATANDGAQLLAKQLGACGWLTKPFGLDLLVSTVHQHMPKAYAPLPL